MDVERTMEFIVETLARVTTRLDALAERMDRAEERASLADARAARTDARLDRAVRLAVQEARNERKRRRELDEKITQLAAAQLITEEKVQKLNDTFQKFLERRDGGGNGSH